MGMKAGRVEGKQTKENRQEGLVSQKGSQVQNALGNVKAAGGLSHTNIHANTRGYSNEDGRTDTWLRETRTIKRN